eukprot:9375328-Pyramimonas_sp.AAC.1
MASSGSAASGTDGEFGDGHGLSLRRLAWSASNWSEGAVDARMAAPPSRCPAAAAPDGGVVDARGSGGKR